MCTLQYSGHQDGTELNLEMQVPPSSTLRSEEQTPNPPNGSDLNGSSVLHRAWLRVRTQSPTEKPGAEAATVGELLSIFKSF